MTVLQSTVAPLVYLLSAVSFFIGCKALAHLRSSARGKPLIAVGLALALLGMLLEHGTGGAGSLLALAVGAAAGAGLAFTLPAGALPTRLTVFPALAGGAVALASLEILLSARVQPMPGVVAGLALVLGLAAAIGATLSVVREQTSRTNAAAALVGSLAGWSVAALGVTLSNSVLIVVGAVAGAAGLALARTVAATADLSLPALLGGARTTAEASGYRFIRSCDSQEAALVLENAARVVVVPGFGMAAAQAQHALKEMAELLEKKGTQVTWVVHPAAGCVPGHMNIVLDEADVKHDRVRVLDEAGEALAGADAALVIGANDVVNPAARTDPSSAVYGMDVPALDKIRTVFVVKRSLRPGAAGVKNSLFEQPNATLLFGDAKKVAQSLVAELKGGAGH